MCIGKLLKCISKSQITCFTFPKVSIEHIFRANTSLSYREDIPMFIMMVMFFIWFAGSAAVRAPFYAPNTSICFGRKFS